MVVVLTENTELSSVDSRLILDLLSNDLDESVYFDFKQGVDNSDPQEVHRIRKAIVSFANTFGGFLLFGILDKTNKQKRAGVDRIVGVSNPDELGKRITQKYLERQLCIPLLSFEGPAIIAVNSHKVATIKIPRSDRRPHAVLPAPDRPLEFWGRGSGTVRPLDYSHLLLELEQGREARGWLNALYCDLQLIIMVCNTNRQVLDGANMVSTLMHALDSILIGDIANILRIFASDLGLIGLITLLRHKINYHNDIRDRLSQQLAVMTAGRRGSALIDGQTRMLKLGAEIIDEANKTLQYLTENYPAAREIIALHNSQAASLKTTLGE